MQVNKALHTRTFWDAYAAIEVAWGGGGIGLGPKLGWAQKQIAQSIILPQKSGSVAPNSPIVFFSIVHPPVLWEAPSGERNHGHATVHNGRTGWSVWGV